MSRLSKYAMLVDLEIAIHSGDPLTWMVTIEEGRLDSQINAWCEEEDRQPWVWSLTGNNGRPGFYHLGNFLDKIQGISVHTPVTSPFDDMKSSTLHSSVLHAIDIALLNREYPYVFIYRDVNSFVQKDPVFVRALKDAFRILKGTQSRMIFVSPDVQIPLGLESITSVIRCILPNLAQMKIGVSRQIADIALQQENLELQEKVKDDLWIEEIAQACLGLPFDEVFAAITKCYVSKDTIEVPYLQAIKTEKINAEPGLKFEPKVEEMESLGGLENFKEWIQKRKNGFSPAAREYGLDYPRGVILFGIPGTGKSLASRITASYFKLPLVTFTPEDLKDKYVGETEGRFRHVLKKIEALGPCVLRIDEMEKSISNNDNHDSGASDTIKGKFLTWLEEREPGAFVIATANNPEKLPPELIRAMRFDDIFFVDLPNKEERIEIFNIHLGKKKQSLQQEEIEALADKSEGYSGAEIRSIVEKAMWDGFSESRPTIFTDYVNAIRSKTPLSKTMGDKIKQLQDWAKDKAIPATKVNKDSNQKKKLKFSEMKRIEGNV